MNAIFWSVLFDTVVRALPRVFLAGAPVLVIAIALAALADTRVPRRS